jgi:P63C domain.
MHKEPKSVAVIAAEGGRARARRLTPQKRAEIAQKGAVTRWTKAGITPLVAEYGDEERPLRIGPIAISCYVLSDGRRVLSQRGLQGGIGLSRSGGKAGARRVAQFLASLGAKGFDTNELIARINNPVRFIPPHGGNYADGYEATILPDICEVVVKADQAGKLTATQRHVAEQCRILLHGFANVGIIALVDEATGYQDKRGRDALAKILEDFVAKELKKWVSTFPSDYYKQLFRLQGWPFPEFPKDQNKRPIRAGQITNDVVYDRLAPGVKDELHRLTPRDSKGRLRHKLFQRLTDDVGSPRLKEHLASVVALMKASDDWDQFMRSLNRALPKWDPNLKFDFDV